MLEEFKDIITMFLNHSEMIKSLAVFLPIVWALFVFTEWIMLQRYYSANHILGFFRPSYKIATDSRYLLSFGVVLIVWILMQFIMHNMIVMYVWAGVLGVLTISVSIIRIFITEELEERLDFFYFFGMVLASLSEQDQEDERESVGKDNEQSNSLWRHITMFFLQKHHASSSSTKIKELEDEVIDGHPDSYKDELNSILELERRLEKTCEFIIALLISWLLVILPKLVDNASLRSVLTIVTFLALCPVWHRFLFYYYGLRFRGSEILKTSLCPEVSTEYPQVCLVDHDGLTYAIMNRQNCDGNIVTVAIRAVVMDWMECKRTAYLFPQDSIALPSPFCGQMYTVNVHFTGIADESRFKKSEEKGSLERELIPMISRNSDKWFRVFQKGMWVPIDKFEASARMEMIYTITEYLQEKQDREKEEEQEEKELDSGEKV